MRGGGVGWYKMKDLSPDNIRRHVVLLYSASVMRLVEIFAHYLFPLGQAVAYFSLI